MLSHNLPDSVQEPKKVLEQLFPSEDEEDSDFAEDEEVLTEDDSEEEQEIPKEEVAEVLIDSQATHGFRRRFEEMDFDDEDDQEYVESEEELTEDEDDLDDLEEEEPMDKEMESVTETMNKIKFVEQVLASDEEDEDYQESIDTVSDYDSDMEQDQEQEVDQEEVVDNLINAGNNKLIKGRVVKVDLLMKDEKVLRDGKEIGQVGDLASKIGKVILEKL